MNKRKGSSYLGGHTVIPVRLKPAKPKRRRKAKLRGVIDESGPRLISKR